MWQKRWAEEPGVQVERVTIADNGSGGVTLTAELTWEGSRCL